MATPGVNLESLANLQSDDLRKLIERPQGLVAARTGKETTPTAPQPPHTPATTAGEEEAILWEQVRTGHVPTPEVPPTRPPPPHDYTQGQTREELATPPRSPSTKKGLNIRRDM